MYFSIFKQNIPRIFWGYFWISSHLRRQPWLLLSCLDPLKTWSHDRFKSDLSIILGYSNLKDVKENFYFHLSVLKSSTFCAFCEAQVYLGNMFMPCSQVTHLISNLVFSTWIWCITFEAILYEENELNSFTRLYCKVFSSTIFNHKHLEYIKSRLTLFLSKFFVSYKRNKHSTPWTSWKTNFGIVKTQTWICAPSCLINIFFSLQNFPYESQCLMARQGFLLCKCIVDKKFLEIGGILDYNLDGKSNKIVLTFVCLNEHLNFCSQICSFHIVGSNF
jgi:hypothetical protein